MTWIPKLLLRRLYTSGSLENTSSGVAFAMKNRLSDGRLVEFTQLTLDGVSVPLQDVRLEFPQGDPRSADGVSADQPIDFPLGCVVRFLVRHPDLDTGKHSLGFKLHAEPFGALNFDVQDAIAEHQEPQVRVPRDDLDDYTVAAVEQRQQFVESFTGQHLEHLKRFSFAPQAVNGNIEHFTGVAQVPIGIAGPLHIDGEHAQGDFLIPLATTEGTLVASYNRGMKVLNLAGGVKCTVVGDAMQRAPVFEFTDARGARQFVEWVQENVDAIRGEAEGTSRVAGLREIDCYQSNKFAYLRFNYTTGDAAGQNMVGRATFAACSWILDHYPAPSGVVDFYLESNLATDKKASQINIMRTRGKRVTAEALIPRQLLIEQLRVEPERLAHHHGIANVGAILSGANNNGLHSANAITALFIATGQDVANVAESSAGVLYVEHTRDGDLYVSITIPSLIIGTHGGGTGLATQQECLGLLGCAGAGKVKRLAEIIAGTVLAGELSLGAAISSLDWVSSHERYGRNR